MHLRQAVHELRAAGIQPNGLSRFGKAFVQPEIMPQDIPQFKVPVRHIRPFGDRRPQQRFGFLVTP